MAKVYMVTLVTRVETESEKNTNIDCDSSELINRMVKILDDKKCYHDGSRSCLNCAQMRYVHRTCMKHILKEMTECKNTQHQQKSLRIVSISNSTHETKEETHGNKFMVKKYSECKFLCSIPEQRNTKEKEEKFQKDLRTSGLGDKDLARRIVTIFNCDT